MRRGSRNVVVVVALGLVLLVAGGAAAQPGNTPVTPTHGPAAPPPPPSSGAPPGEKSPGVALTLSLGGTVGSYLLLIASDEARSDGLASVGAIGMFLAPSFGHWYAGKGWTEGLTLRLAGVGAVFVGALLLIGGGDDHEVPAAVLLVGGTGAYVAGTVVDIAAAPGQARRYNARLRERAASTWTLAPLVTHDRTGFALTGRF